MEPSGVVDSPRRLRRIVPALSLVLAVGCSPAASQAPITTPGPTAAGQASSAPTTSPTRTPRPTSPPPGPFRVVGTEPVISRNLFDDRGAVLPGAIMSSADGTFHAWVIAFADVPGIQEVHHLTSPDALAWTEAADASLERLSEGLGNPGALPTSVLETEDDWVMYYVGRPAAVREGGWVIYRATADGPNGPWTRDAQAVLQGGPAGSWDAAGLDFPSVIRTGTGYALFYSAIATQQAVDGSIGIATSEDGITWTKHDDPSTTDARFAASDPVVEPGLCGDFDDRATHQPRVLPTEDGLVMIYAGYAGEISSRPGVGYAKSTDGGLTWTCEWPGNALDPAGLPAGIGLHTVNAFLRDGRVSLLVEWLSQDGTDDWLAELPE